MKKKKQHHGEMRKAKQQQPKEEDKVAIDRSFSPPSSSTKLLKPIATATSSNDLKAINVMAF